MTAEFTLPSEQDKVLLHGLLMAPDEGTPRGLFQIVHGMSEHKGRYIPFMTHLAQKGYVCVIHDHRGHGDSVASEADLGYLGKQGAKALVADTHLVAQYARQQYPKLPHYLMGHSMGSMVVRSYLKEHDGLLSALIVCGSPSYNGAAPFGKALASLIAAIKGDHYRSPFLNRMAFGLFSKQFTEETEANTWISADRENVTRYNEDPRCGFVFTANGFHELFSLMQDAYNKDRKSVV